MNKVITINLNGVAYQLEESGYEALHAYLELAARRLEGNPDKAEILADIEQAIADKFRALLGAHKTVVNSREVADVITQMGPVQDASGATAEPVDSKPASSASPGTAPGVRRLYRLYDGAQCSGVCNGLAAYFGVDVSFVRIGFVVLTLCFGSGVLAYWLLALIIPTAKTPEEKKAAQGGPSTAEEFIHRARAGYYEGMKTLHDKEAHRAWKRRFKQAMRDAKYGFHFEWRDNAAQGKSPDARPWAAAHCWRGEHGLTHVLLSWLRLACLIFVIYAIIKLIGTRAVCGLALPAGIPVWVGVIGLIVAYQVVTWPLKVMRHAGHYWRARYPWNPLAGLLDSLVWLAICVALIWCADHYSPAFHDWLQSVPPTIHRLTDAVHEWWARR